MSTEQSSADIFDAGNRDREADKILGALRDKPDGMTRHEIRRRLFNANLPAPSIASMLVTLQRLGLVRSERIIKTGGRPAERWYAINALTAESPPAAVCPPPDIPPVEPEPDVDPASLIPPAADDRDDRRHRATEYLAAMGREGGHGPAWDAARLLIKGFGLTPEEAFPLLAEWNRKCQSPLGDFDLRWKLSHVARRSPYGVG